MYTLMNILDAGIHMCQMMSFEEINNALDLITINGAKTLNISNEYGIEVGKKANFIVLNAKTEFEAIYVLGDIIKNDKLLRRNINDFNEKYDMV